MRCVSFWFAVLMVVGSEVSNGSNMQLECPWRCDGSETPFERLRKTFSCIIVFKVRMMANYWFFMVIEKCDLDDHKRILPMLGFAEQIWCSCTHSWWEVFEFITAVLINMPGFWLMKPCRVVCRYRRFGGTCFLYLQIGPGRASFMFTARGTWSCYLEVSGVRGFYSTVSKT
jgi:hypothetical protein